MKTNISLTAWSVAGFFAILPFVSSVNLFYGAVNAKYFFILGFISFLSLFFAYSIIWQKHHLSIQRRWLLGLSFFLLLFYYLSTWLGISSSTSWGSDILRSSGLFFLSYIALFAFIAGEVLEERGWSLVRKSIAISGAVFAGLTFFANPGLALSAKFFNIDFSISGLTFANSTFAGTYLFLALVVTLIEWTRSESKRLGWFVLSGLYLLSPLLFNADIWLGKLSFLTAISNPALFLGDARSSSAAAWLAVIFLTGLWLISKIKVQKIKSKLNIVWAGLIVLGLVSAIGLLFTSGSFIQDAYIEQSTAARIIVWDIGLQALSDRPLLGFGPENFRFAFEQNFDQRLLLDENLGEIWFDRAHNIIIDTLVAVGFVGAFLLLILWSYFLFIVYRAVKRDLISEIEGWLLGALILGHFLQLQTSFNTVSSYIFLALIFGYGLWLERELQVEKLKIDNKFNIPQKVGGISLVIVILIFSWQVGQDYIKQRALVNIFQSNTPADQIINIDKALDSYFGFEAIRLPASSMVKGGLEAIAEGKGDQGVTALVNNQLDLYLSKYEQYLARVPNDYRAQINYIYLSLVRTALGENRLKEAEAVVLIAYDLSPQHPLTLIMDSLVKLYSGDVIGAKTKINEAVTINPNIKLTETIEDYIIKQEKQFPEITVIKLENL